MPVLANARYERFAQIVADGKLTPTGAYRETLGADARDPDVNSCRWMKKPPIAERIAELKAKAADKCSLSREAYIRSLDEMYEAKPADASMDNPRCDVLITRGQKHAVFPQKLAVGGATLQAGWLGPPDRGAGGGRERAGHLSWQAFRGGRERWAAAVMRGENGERSQETSGSASGGRR